MGYKSWALFPIAIVFAIFILGLSSGCQAGKLISDVSLLNDTISPNGDGVNDFTHIGYTLSRKARVSIVFIGEDGRKYPFRNQELRSAGGFRAAIYGNYAPEEGKADRRVMPNGVYTYIVSAVDDNGRKEEWSSKLTVKDADNDPPLVKDVVLLPDTISPNGDAVDDEMVINYKLTKKSWLAIFVTDVSGRNHLLEAENEKSAALHPHRWNGTSGGKLLPDGEYTIHIRARDRSGNVTDRLVPTRIAGGGKSRMEITDVRFYPTALPVGGDLNVEIKVKNTGETVLRTLGPPPGTPYDTLYNFLYFKGDDGQPLYYERAGFWRVGVGWNIADRPYPVRWGLFDDLDRMLQPGEEATITGTIKILIDRTREVYFWASAVQEGIGFGEQVGQQKIIISY